MKCKECNGVGYVKTISVGGVPCSSCNGTGKIEQTKQKWLQTCSAEEFAEWLAERMDTPCDICRYDCRSKCMANAKQVWLEWLKEIHHE